MFFIELSVSLLQCSKIYCTPHCIIYFGACLKERNSAITDLIDLSKNFCMKYCCIKDFLYEMHVNKNFLVIYFQ